MCQGGNCRSVAMAYILKYALNQDALACGYEKNSPQTLSMLYKWAEKIIVMQQDFTRCVDPSQRDKILTYDVGPDKWCNSFHPELLTMLQNMMLDRQDIVPIGKI